MPTGQVLTHEGRSLALVDLGKDASAALRASWSGDQPLQSGGAMNGTWVLPALGASSTAASSLMAGNVFLATAHPGTLMTIGTGVGSAVMGPTGIITHAPFVAASGALVPVVAPVMLFATVSSAMMCARLDRAQQALGRLAEVVERVRRVLDADDYARLETAAEQIDEIRSEFQDAGQFASDVPDRLARLGHDVGVLCSKYELLATGAIHSEDSARTAVSDLNRFFVATIYDLQIDVLRLHLALQNDPDVVPFRLSGLQERLEQCRDGFRRILADDRVGAYHRNLKETLGGSRWEALFRRVRHLRGGEAAANELRSVRAIRRDFEAGRRRVEGWLEALATTADGSRRESVVLYREADGKRALRAHRTPDIHLERVD